jgi:hypothetical protein
VKPAIRIVFAPLFKRDKTVRDAGQYLHGTASGRTVTIDPRSSSLLDTFVHELTHIRHPSWPESAVEEHTKRRLKKMSWKEKARLLQLLGSGKIEGE